jgi:signal peptidase I
MNRWGDAGDDSGGEHTAAGPPGMGYRPRIPHPQPRAQTESSDQGPAAPRVVGRATVTGPVAPVIGRDGTDGRDSTAAPANSAPTDTPGVRASTGAPAGRAVGRIRIMPSTLDDPSLLIDNDESNRFVEGRPGQELAGDLAEQRKRELPSTRDVERAQDERRWIMPMWQELPLLLVVAFCVAVLIRSFLVQAFVIPSSSMEQTLLIGDRVMVNKVVYGTRDPQRGEVVVFRGTDRWAPENFDEQPGGVLDRIGDTLGDLVGISRPGEKDFIKRVIGLPGDRVRCCDDQGRVVVFGVGIELGFV